MLSQPAAAEGGESEGATWPPHFQNHCGMHIPEVMLLFISVVSHAELTSQW